jgi:hypothetical protein
LINDLCNTASLLCFDFNVQIYNSGTDAQKSSTTHLLCHSQLALDLFKLTKQELMAVIKGRMTRAFKQVYHLLL